jgi:multidrug transporter EmrE-like cation transporter
MIEIISLIFGISCCEALAQTCIRYYKIHKTFLLLVTAILFYALVVFLLHKSYKYKGVGLVNVLWSGMSIIIMLSVGIIVFKEDIHLHDMIGILLIVIGMFLILVNK